jgi:hypothetical protein
VTAWPDVEGVVITDLLALAGVNDAGTETPADLDAQLPFVRVMRRGGPTDRLNDRPRLDIDVFAATRSAGVPLALEIVRHLMDDYSVSAVDRFECEAGPAELPWSDGAVRRWGMTFQAVARRTS